MCVCASVFAIYGEEIEVADRKRCEESVCDGSSQQRPRCAARLRGAPKQHTHTRETREYTHRHTRRRLDIIIIAAFHTLLQMLRGAPRCLHETCTKSDFQQVGFFFIDSMCGGGGGGVFIFSGLFSGSRFRDRQGDRATV